MKHGVVSERELTTKGQRIVVFLIVSLLFSSVARAEQASEGQGQPPAASYECELIYEPTGAGLWVPGEYVPGSTPFAKEPNLGPEKVFRFKLRPQESQGPGYGIIWDKAKNKLYIDTNLNGDFTEEVDGVFECADSNPNYQNFNAEFFVDFNDIKVPYKLRLLLYDFGYNPHCSARVTSSFGAEIEMSGGKWRLEISDNMDGKFGVGDRLYLAPADANDSVRHIYNYTDIPESLFFDGHCYQLSLQFEAGESEPFVRAKLTEIHKTMGRLSLKGEFIKRLVLQSGEMLAILERPEPNVTVPVGDYRCANVYVGNESAGPFVADNIESGVSVDANRPAVLAVGAPLNHAVKVRRSGRFLGLEYELTDIGGNSYQAINRNSERAPGFVARKGGKEIASGSFEYG